MSSVLVATYPGISLHGKSVELLSNGIRSNRTCSIQISNHLNVPLSGPSFYNFLGVPYYNPQPAIQPKTREACSFAKKRDAPLGVKGVMTYQVGDSQLRLAVMFSVPYNQLAEQNHFGIAFLDDSSVNSGLVGSSLFNRMYNDETFYGRPDRKMCPANGSIRLWIDNGDYGICGTMNERGKAIIKLDIVPM